MVGSKGGAVSRSCLLPLPHNRCGDQSGLSCGGEGRGEGDVSGPLTLALSPATRHSVFPYRSRGRGDRQQPSVGKCLLREVPRSRNP